LMYMGRSDDGLIAAHEAVRIFDLRQGRRSGASIDARTQVAEAYRVMGKLEPAAKAYAEVVSDAEAVYGTAHPGWADIASAQAILLISLGRNDEARALLERVIPVLMGSRPAIAAAAKFMLAKLVEPADHARAISLATEAEATLRNDPASEETRANVAAWLRDHTRARRTR